MRGGKHGGAELRSPTLKTVVNPPHPKKTKVKLTPPRVAHSTSRPAQQRGRQREENTRCKTKTNGKKLFLHCFQLQLQVVVCLQNVIKRLSEKFK